MDSTLADHGGPERQPARRLPAVEGQHQFVFHAGLRRSGTTPLARLLAAHTALSGFSDTGDQQLQGVYPAAKESGGPGRFGYSLLSPERGKPRPSGSGRA